MAARGLRLDRTLGPVVVSWTEANLCHGPGDVQGQPVELDDEQTAFILRAYEIDDAGKRRVRRAVHSRPARVYEISAVTFAAYAGATAGVRSLTAWCHEAA